MIQDVPSELHTLKHSSPELWARLMGFVTGGPIGRLPAVAEALAVRLDDLVEIPGMAASAVYDALGEHLHMHLSSPDAVQASLREEYRWRIAERARHVATLCPRELRIEALLDYGCGPGWIALEIGLRAGVPKTQIFGCDVAPPQAPLRYVSPEAFGLGELDGGIDLVLALVVLHHLDAAEATIQKFHDVLRPGGALIVREHDASSVPHRVFFDAMHEIWERVYCYRQPTMVNARNYRSMSEWDAAFESAGFERTPAAPRIDRLCTEYRVYRKLGAGTSRDRAAGGPAC